MIKRTNKREVTITIDEIKLDATRKTMSIRAFTIFKNAEILRPQYINIIGKNETKRFNEQPYISKNRSQYHKNGRLYKSPGLEWVLFVEFLSDAEEDLRKKMCEEKAAK